MISRDESVRVNQQEAAVRRAYRGGELDAETVAFLRKADPVELCSTRISIVHDICEKMVDQATAAALFPGDTSQARVADVLDIIGTWFAFTLLTELGDEAALKELEQLTDAVSLGL